MVNYGAYSTEKPFELYGKSSEEKPIGKYNGTAIPDSSTYYEKDTGDLYMYDKEDAQWYKQ